MQEQRIHIDVRGEGGENVVVLHGCPTQPAHMERLAAAIAEKHRVFLVHLPGYGRSPAPEAAYSMEEASAWVEAELLARGVGEAALVGYSSGAYRAFCLLARGRLRWRGVVALAGFADIPEEQRAGYVQIAQLLLEGVDFSDYLRENFVTAEVRANAPEIVEEVGGWVHAVAPEALSKELLAYAEGEDLLVRLGDFRNPVLALVGEQDQVQSPEVSRAIAEAAPLGELQVLPGVGHILLREDFAGTFRAVEEFLGRLSA